MILQRDPIEWATLQDYQLNKFADRIQTAIIHIHRQKVHTRSR